MTYGADDVSDDLTRVLEGTASFDERARLEHHLLTLLRADGGDAVAALLHSLPAHDFRSVDDDLTEYEARFVTAGPGPRHLVVATYLAPEVMWVNVTVEDTSVEPAEPDPRHQAFYDMWESLLGVSDSEVAKLDPVRKAVYLMARLEAEVMNGGLGQYLTNTDGVLLEDTVRCLGAIGARRTRAILLEAAALGAEAASYVAAWESRSKDFERLDGQFMDSGEDLAILTAEAFLSGGRGKGPTS
jgi:hypothetical protein